ncbi:GGDEF domain-containing protein [Gemmatimonas groenlandica]|uniref:diguanylate cyclase n=1 Tax=Gemmatimonas groenlandica TaxID=2732249 RepID=A0A6M4IVX0_9BACT|nr:sensor domain-containing diguanylate cyclase [Gemmatimonas groenlandica]QJR37666.1 sensor domain-containing diguanylate cyclase [Gemmatimonas groenlandica]
MHVLSRDRSSWLAPEQHFTRLTDPARLAAVRASQLLDGATNDVLDRLARLTTRLLHVPVALVSLVDDRGQHFPGMAGLGGWAGAQRGTPLTHSFCQYVVTNGTKLIVEDASVHPLVMDNMAFGELGVVAYAGVPLRTSGGENLGSMCAIDTAPVQWTVDQIATLEDLAAAAMAEIELRSTLRALTAAQERLQHQVERDSLTGLYNRRGFSERAKHHLALAQRTAMPFSVLALDLDAFKQINDCFGHDIGDEALVEMASLLSEAIRDSDLAARLGGDEFTLLLSGTTGRDSDVFIGRLHAAIDAANAREERDFVLSSSIGVATWLPEAPQSLATLMRSADEALYADKRARKLHAVKIA